MTLRERSTLFTRRTNFTTVSREVSAGAAPAAASAVLAAVAARVPPLSSIAYGSTGGFKGPGASRCVESTSTQPSGTARRRNAVPRRSVMSPIASPAASRCAMSTICRSPLPYTSRSALASSRMERRTFSDQ